MKIYDTKLRALVDILPKEYRPLRIYTCGPTVYNFAHIGNFRTYIFEDLLRRAVKFFGAQVEQVMNITDIDDKTLKGAIEQGVSLETFTKPFEDAFFADLDTLRIERAEKYPKATDHIPEMIEMIDRLIHKGFAYAGSDGNVYFSIERFPNYGKLSHLKLDELEEGASMRVASDEYEKENASDFVLWKAYDSLRDGDIFWQSPFGDGRPGWHIECSAMALKHLESPIDLHCGGVDNIFPHHENEIAQSECCTDSPFVKHWAHSAHLLVDGKKMSKSAGNFYTLRDLLDKGYDGRTVRYLLMTTHYRTQLNFTFDGLNAAKQALYRLDAFKRRMEELKGPSTAQVESHVKTLLSNFAEALSDDLNISEALAALFECVRHVNALCEKNVLGKEDGQQVLKALKRIDQVLTVFETEESEIPQEIQDLFEKRQEARASKEWAESDRLRDKLLALGYEIEDSREGSRVRKI